MCFHMLDDAKPSPENSIYGVQDCIRTQSEIQHYHYMRKRKQSDFITFQGLPTAKVREVVGKELFKTTAKVSSLTLGIVKGRVRVKGRV